MNALLLSDGLKSTKGLGSIFDPSNPIILPPATPATSTQSASSILDKINSGVTAVANTVKTVQNTVSSFNPPTTSLPSSPTITLTPAATPASTPPASKGLSTGAKVGIGLGIAAALAAVGVAIVKSGKKKSVSGVAGVKKTKKRAKK